MLLGVITANFSQFVLPPLFSPSPRWGGGLQGRKEIDSWNFCLRIPDPKWGVLC